MEFLELVSQRESCRRLGGHLAIPVFTVSIFCINTMLYDNGVKWKS